jgi:hypothetical protein
MNATAYKAAITKAMAGEALNARETRAVDYLTDVANGRLRAEQAMGREEFELTAHDVRQAGGEHTTENVLANDAVTKVMTLDPDFVERAAIKYENDDIGFQNAIRGYLDEFKAASREQQSQDAGGSRQADNGAARQAAGGGAEQADPVRQAADRFVENNPDRVLTLGTDEQGRPIQKTAKQYLDDIRAEVDLAREDASLFEIAASCMLGGR